MPIVLAQTVNGKMQPLSICPKCKKPKDGKICRDCDVPKDELRYIKAASMGSTEQIVQDFLNRTTTQRDNK